LNNIELVICYHDFPPYNTIKFNQKLFWCGGQKLKIRRCSKTIKLDLQFSVSNFEFLSIAFCLGEKISNPIRIIFAGVCGKIWIIWNKIMKTEWTTMKAPLKNYKFVIAFSLVFFVLWGFT